MTYAELMAKLGSLTKEQLTQTVTVLDNQSEEYYAVTSVVESDEECDVLDNGLVVFVFNNP